jgi:site-specific DNA-methyltransferase (adenine-specific)
MSNIKNYKYDWIWEKNTCTGFMQAKTKPLKSHENILVFGDFKVAAQYFKGTYIPAGVEDVGEVTYSNKRGENHITGNRNPSTTNAGKGYPKDIIRFNSEQKTVHPTQKPVALLEYLIKTYTLEGETVLDNCMGSGSTGVACINTNRSFIGIEKDDKCFEISKSRIEKAQQEQKEKLFR